MNKEFSYGIGLMSGTSLDGLDIAFVKFEKANEVWNYELLETQFVEFPNDLLSKLQNARELSALELAILDVDYGSWLGEKTQKFILDRQVKVDFIASHGFTVFHQPKESLTLQIGSGYEIYAKCMIPVVYDFRRMDVVLGGQGAPLVPIGDRLLFHQYDFCLNLGGIANVSTEYNGKRIAYDIVPVNQILNHQAKRMGLDFDPGGKNAASGTVIPALFDRLEKLDFYSLSFPKSLGNEWVENNILNIELLGSHSPQNVLATFCSHISKRIASDIKKTKTSGIYPQSVLVTGGGSHNAFLIQKLTSELGKNFEILLPDKDLIDFKEALIFSFLGLLKLRGNVNCLASVTGASQDCSGGIIINRLS